MKKRFIVPAIAVFFLITVLQVSIFASDALMPRNNVATTTTNISVFAPGSCHSFGRAIINLRYTGFPEVTDFADISLTVERKTGLFFWETIARDAYTTEDIYHMNKWECPLEEYGTYRFTVTYAIAGKGGEDDVVRITEIRKYDATSPPFPPIHKTEALYHDCTSQYCCEDCFPIIGATPAIDHCSNGDWRVYDDGFHYSVCKNNTVSSTSCLQIIKEPHRYDTAGTCAVCNYRQFICAESYDEKTNTVALSVWADGSITAYVDDDWLEPEAKPIVWNEEGREITIYKHFENVITLHIPLEEYAVCKAKGIELYLLSHGRSFYITVYPEK